MKMKTCSTSKKNRRIYTERKSVLISKNKTPEDFWFRKSKKNKMGKKQKSTLDTTESDKNTPKSIVIYRGEVGSNVRHLMHEWRRVFMPWVSQKLHGRNSSLRDFLAIAGHFSASHLQIFSTPPRGAWLRIMRFPAGPTLSFRVESFTLRDDIAASQRKPAPINGAAYNSAPIVVLNNFALPGQKPEVELMAKAFQSLFPTVNIHLVKPSDIQRVVMFNYDPTADAVEVRHYYVSGKAVGLSKTVKKLFEGRVPTKMGTIDDIDDVVQKEGVWSDTDGEGEEVPLVTPFRALKGRCRVRLVEIGPRMTWKLVKVESGFAGGETLFHDESIEKSQNEISANARRIRSKQLTKKIRRDEQDANVARKKEIEEEKRVNKKRKTEDDDGATPGFQEVSKADM